MTLTISAALTKNTGDPATGLTLSEIDLYLYAENKATGAITTIWDGTQNPTVEVSNIGMYVRQYGSEDLLTYNYYAGAHYTGATVLDAEWATGVASWAGATPDELHDEVVEGTLTFRQIIRIILAHAGGLTTGGGTLYPKFRDNADSKNRISATVDSSGNRTAVTLDGT